MEDGKVERGKGGRVEGKKVDSWKVGKVERWKVERWKGGRWKGGKVYYAFQIYLKTYVFNRIHAFRVFISFNRSHVHFE